MLCLSICVSLCVNYAGTNHNCYTQTCNLACTDLLMNPDRTPKTTSVCLLISFARFQFGCWLLILVQSTALKDSSPWRIYYVLSRMFNSADSLFSSLIPSTPAVPNCCCLKGSAPYWSNPLFLIFDIPALWRSGLSARVPECQKLKIVG